MIKSALFATLLTACTLASASNPLYTGQGNYSPTPTDICCSTSLYEASGSLSPTPVDGFDGTLQVNSNPLYSGGR